MDGAHAVTSTDLALSDLATDYAALEAQLVETVCLLRTYREMVQLALPVWHAETKRARASTQRLRQLLGVETSTPENEPS